MGMAANHKRRREEQGLEIEQKDTRNVASRAWDMLNVADSGRSWGRANPDERGKELSSGDQFKKFGGQVIGGVEKVQDSIDSLAGHTQRELNDLAEQFRKGEITNKEYQKQLTDIQEDIAWAGTEDKGYGNRLIKSAAVAAETASDLMPATKGVTTSAKALKQIAKQGGSKMARNAAAKKAAKESAKFGAATGGVGSGAATLAEDGATLQDVALGTLAGTALGAGMGAGGAALGAIPSRIKPASADYTPSVQAAKAMSVKELSEGVERLQAVVDNGIADGLAPNQKTVQALDFYKQELSSRTPAKPGAETPNGAVQARNALLPEQDGAVDSPVVDSPTADSPTADSPVGLNELTTDTEPVSVASDISKTPNKTTNAILKKSTYGGKVSDNISSFVRSIENAFENSGGKQLTTELYDKVYRRITQRNTLQNILAETLNKKLGLNNKQKIKIGERVGDLLRSVPDEDMNMLSPEDLATKYGSDVEVSKAAKTVKTHFRQVLDEVNKVRVQRGQDEIPFEPSYMPQWAEPSGGKPGKRITPDEKFNPFAQKRTGNNQDFEKNVFKVLDQYNRYAANEVRLTPAVQHVKGWIKVLEESGNTKGAKWLDDFIQTALVKNRPGTLDEWAGVVPGTKRSAVLNKINIARSLSGLVGNITWMVKTQPQSLATTVGKMGYKNTLKGAMDWFTDPAIRKMVKNTDTYKLKRSQSVGATAGGQLDRLSSSVLKTRREFANDFMNVPANYIEQSLDGIAAAAARRRGLGHVKNGVMNEAGLNNMMNWGIEATQSVYVAEARPLIMQNISARAGFPFQTYSFEMWRHLNNIAKGQGSGFRLEKTQRVVQATKMITAIMLANAAQKAFTDDNVASPGSVIPIAGGAVNKAIDSVAGTEFSYYGNRTIALENDATRIISSVKSFADDGDTEALTKSLISWGMGLSGIGGASTVNRIIDGAVETDKETISNYNEKKRNNLTPAQERQAEREKRVKDKRARAARRERAQKIRRSNN